MSAKVKTEQIFWKVFWKWISDSPPLYSGALPPPRNQKASRFDQKERGSALLSSAELVFITKVVSVCPKVGLAAA
jgi:hypothetical protein